jgi:hypothetical protein
MGGLAVCVRHTSMSTRRGDLSHVISIRSSLQPQGFGILADNRSHRFVLVAWFSGAGLSVRTGFVCVRQGWTNPKPLLVGKPTEVVATIAPS